MPYHRVGTACKLQRLKAAGWKQVQDVDDDLGVEAAHRLSELTGGGKELRAQVEAREVPRSAWGRGATGKQLPAGEFSFCHLLYHGYALGLHKLAVPLVLWGFISAR